MTEQVNCDECQNILPCPDVTVLNFSTESGGTTEVTVNECVIKTLFPMYVDCIVVEPTIPVRNNGSVSLFVSGTVMDARYTRWDNPVTEVDPAKAITNKRVEYAPQQLWRCGATYKVENLSATIQWSYVGDVYTDAVNTEEPSTNAQAGMLPSYQLLDASLKYQFTSNIFLQSSINNVLNTHYATRRAGGYPGPGLLPGTGRTVTVTLGLNL
jgi:Fe(3+) dicitrate transport protein